MLQEQLPSPDALDQLFSDLLDVKTEVLMGKDIPLAPGEDPVIVASFQDDGEVIKGLCLCDIQAANRMGSALTMIPVELANKSITNHEVSDDILNNLKEVMNCITGFLNTPNSPALKLKDVVTLTGDLPDEVAALANDPNSRLDLEVNIQNYGQGYLSILLGDLS